MVVGYLADAFDMINVRDLDLIAQAGERCSWLVLGVFTDEHTEAVLGRRPVVPLSERLALVQHVRGVHEVVVHGAAEQHGPGPQRDGVAASRLVFVAADLPLPYPEQAEVLSPRRRSNSVQLRAALGSVEQREAVA